MNQGVRSVDFSVNVAGIRGLATLLQRASEDAHQARTYAFEKTDLEWSGEGIVNHLSGGHRTIRTEVMKWWGTVRDDTTGVPAAAVRAAASYYERADLATETRFDQGVTGIDVGVATQGVPKPPPISGPVADNRLAGLFTDRSECIVVLKPPPDYNGELPYEPNWTDLASPTALVRDAIWTVTWAAAKLGICDRPYDVAEVLLKPMAGDWAGFRACADVYRNVGLAAERMGQNIINGAAALPFAWRGNSADNCETHLFLVGKALLDAKPVFDELARRYEEAAQGVNDLRSFIGNMLNDVGDLAVSAAAAALTAGGAAGTGVGLPVAVLLGGAVLYKINKVAWGVVEMARRVDKLQKWASLWNSAAEAFGDLSGDLRLPEPPRLDRATVPQ
jgi:hypothetical protein